MFLYLVITSNSKYQLSVMKFYVCIEQIVWFDFFDLRILNLLLYLLFVIRFQANTVVHQFKQLIFISFHFE